jgi:curved DNA-binding protein
VTLKVPPGTRTGQQLRLTGRGMARGQGTPGNLYAIAHIEVPSVTDDKQRALYQQLAEISNFNPRAQLDQETTR